MYRVEKTDDRKAARSDYIMIIHPETARERHLGRFAAVEYTPQKRQLMERVRQNGSGVLRVACRVVRSEDVGQDYVRLDQTLRNALGIPQELVGQAMVMVYPLDLSLLQSFQDVVSRLLGRRFLFFRVCKAFPTDMEKDFCRLPSDAFRVMGCDPGDKVVCEAVIPDARRPGRFRLLSRTMRAYDVSDRMLDKRIEEENDNPDRYPPSERLLGVKPDLLRIFLDQDGRGRLGVDVLDPVRCRRNLLDLFSKQLREFGIVMLLSVLAVGQIIPEEVRERWGLMFYLASAAISVSIALILILASIRVRIR